MLQHASKMNNLQNDSGAKYISETSTLCDFWLKLSDMYPNVGKEVLKKLLLVPSTYLCVCGFSPSAREKKSKPAQFYSGR